MLLREVLLTPGDFSATGATERAVSSKGRDLAQERCLPQHKQLFLVTYERKASREIGSKLRSE